MNNVDPAARRASSRLRRLEKRARSAADESSMLWTDPHDLILLIERVKEAERALASEKERADAVCGLCGQPMPIGEKSFRYHGYSGPCPPSEEEVTRLQTRLRAAEEVVEEAIRHIGLFGSPDPLRDALRAYDEAVEK